MIVVLLLTGRFPLWGLHQTVKYVRMVLQEFWKLSAHIQHVTSQSGKPVITLVFIWFLIMILMYID